MAGAARDIRRFARTIVRDFQRGGAISEKTLGYLLVSQHLHSWLEGYEQAVADFFASENGDIGDESQRGKVYHGIKTANANHRMKRRKEATNG